MAYTLVAVNTEHKLKDLNRSSAESIHEDYKTKELSGLDKDDRDCNCRAA